MPVDDSGTVTLLARLSLSGMLIVDDGGLLVAVGVTATKPTASCWVTVTLPVTATAPAGMPPTPVTCQVRATLAVNLPDSPIPPGGYRGRAPEVIGDVRRAGGLEAGDPGLPFRAGARILVGLPHGRRDERILGHADVVAPALPGVHAGAGLEQLLRADRVRCLGGQLVRGVGRREVTCRGGRPAPHDVEGAVAGHPHAAHVAVLAVLGDEEVLPKRRADHRADTGRVELADPDAVAHRGVAGRRARIGRHERQQVVLPDRIGGSAVDGIRDRVRAGLVRGWWRRN